MKYPAALIVDDMQIKAWQLAALEQAADYLEIKVILNCTNTRYRRHLGKHFAYYVLNRLALKNPLTRHQTIEDLVAAEKIDFESVYEGAWQHLPGEVIDRLEGEGIRLVIKFGMSLLRIDEGAEALDILSFHHGDPENYRGRPAGFYEILYDEKKIGIIVQKLSNRLDGGEVLCKAYSPVYPYSYRKTAVAFYRNSCYLLRKAVENYMKGERIHLSRLGTNYRLPGNLVVARFSIVMLCHFLGRLCYGALFEKRWNIVTFPARRIEELGQLAVAEGRRPCFRNGYSFYADPFLRHDGEQILVEAMNARNGQGEIVNLDARTLKITSNLLRGKHYSYPYTFLEEQQEYLIPEVASHSSPLVTALLSPQQNDMACIPLDGLQDKRLVDGTLVKHNGHYYFFCGSNDSAANCLLIYVSESFQGPYRAHPRNPVVIDPESARMGGRVLQEEGVLYRLGQNNCRGYGESLMVNKIIRLTPDEYLETPMKAVSFRDAKGPHTLDTRGDVLVMDYYVDTFSLLAGYRRLAGRLLGGK